MPTGAQRVGAHAQVACPRQLPRDGRVAGGKAGTGGRRASARCRGSCSRVHGTRLPAEVTLLPAQAKASVCAHPDSRTARDLGDPAEQPHGRLGSVAPPRPRRRLLQLDNFLRPWNLIKCGEICLFDIKKNKVGLFDTETSDLSPQVKILLSI